MLLNADSSSRHHGNGAGGASLSRAPAGHIPVQRRCKPANRPPSAQGHAHRASPPRVPALSLGRNSALAERPEVPRLRDECVQDREGIRLWICDSRLGWAPRGEPRQYLQGGGGGGGATVLYFIFCLHGSLKLCLELCLQPEVSFKMAITKWKTQAVSFSPVGLRAVIGGGCHVPIFTIEGDGSE